MAGDPVRADRPVRDPRRALLVLRVLVGVLVLAVAIVVGAVLRGQHNQLEQLRRQNHAACLAFATVGRPALLTPKSSELAREIVGRFAQAAQIAGCVKR
jgi:uncharacterized membrane protein YjfL (UPF0719 family)